MQKKQRFWNLLLLFIGSICIFLSGKHYDDCVPEAYYNKARVLLSEEREMLAEGKMTDFKPVIAVDYYLLDLGGIVKKEQGSGYEVGQKVNLTEALQTDSSYYKTNKDRIKVAFPIEKRERTVGFAIFLLKRMQKEMISCISHDLRTPLSTIKAYASGIYDGIAVDQKMQKEYADSGSRSWALYL